MDKDFVMKVKPAEPALPKGDCIKSTLIGIALILNPAAIMAYDFYTQGVLEVLKGRAILALFGVMVMCLGGYILASLFVLEKLIQAELVSKQADEGRTRLNFKVVDDDPDGLAEFLSDAAEYEQEHGEEHKKRKAMYSASVSQKPVGAGTKYSCYAEDSSALTTGEVYTIGVLGKGIVRSVRNAGIRVNRIKIVLRMFGVFLPLGIFGFCVFGFIMYPMYKIYYIVVGIMQLVTIYKLLTHPLLK